MPIRPKRFRRQSVKYRHDRRGRNHLALLENIRTDGRRIFLTRPIKRSMESQGEGGLAVRTQSFAKHQL